MDRTVKIQITGKVQGVWFRASAKDEALTLGLKGKVWNNPDQSVGAIAQGPVDKISVFIEWCKNGPPLAKVENVLEVDIEENVHFTSFEISRSE
ncbi:MAG: acylphosphatase [Saprospiraceae bacterium]|uniref:acylphosphatase n=1 Tax=Candidatus Opimibacter skivensis TaxID=2982028 RepID=A0A9D7SUY0_9BACT|nr:acylphosphatase [Candidatus Opimibacter skivensis]